MTYRVEPSTEPRERFGDYRYRVYRDDRLLAYYWHDYRGDDHGLEFVDGRVELNPLGDVASFMAGGGPEPLVLTPRGVAYLERCATEAADRPDRENR